MNVLFICNGNVARSQEAAAYFNASAGNRPWHAASAGIEVDEGKPLDPLVIQAMDEEGISLAQVYRKQATEHMAEEADIIISFKAAAELPGFISGSSKTRYWNVADQRHQDISFHRATRDVIKGKVQQLVSELA